MDEKTRDRETLAHLRLAADLAGLEIAECILPSQHDVTLRGRRFHWVDWGREARPPVLFLHGGGQTARTWDLVCLALRQEWRCIALDQRGHGDSEWWPDGDYGPESQAGDIAAFVDALGLERLVVVGMSMGCFNALHFALDHPDRLAALVAVDAGPWYRPEGSRPILEFLERRHAPRTLEEHLAIALRFNPRRDPRLLRMSLLHNLRPAGDGLLQWKTDPNLRASRPAFGRSTNTLQARVGELAVPVLIVRGAESEVFLDEDAERFARAVPNGGWVRIEGAGHTVQGDNPKALVAALRAFLRPQSS